ncbi:MAG: hypothetical protein GC190_20785 [Alphaproteobacteria bacterium]|nr:hypothetical protein [Alphaproteobacteria bacterium]
MSYHHTLYMIGNKVCLWTGALAQHVWPQTACNADEAWSLGAIIVGLLVILAVFSLARRIHGWHNYYR